MPTFARCVPGQCANARFGPEHRAGWQSAHDHAEALLVNRRSLPVNQTLVLELSRDEYARILRLMDELIDESHGRDCS